MTGNTSRIAVTAEGLRKDFGAVRALDGVDLEIPRGQVLGLLGPNGAGKTTTVRVLSTLLRPDAGRATVNGYDVVGQPDAVRRSIGLSGQFTAVDESLTGQENIVLFARLIGLSKAEATARAARLIDRFGLREAARRAPKTYSGGMRRRLDLAGALVGEPAVVVLDEPTTGLDPRGRIDTWELVSDLVADGTTVLLTTQYLEEADHLADTIAVIDRGRVIAHDQPGRLKAQVGGDRLRLVVVDAADLNAAADILAEVGVSQPQIETTTRTVTVAVTTGARALVATIQRLEAAGIELLDVGLQRPTLDDVFLSLTENAHRPDRELAGAETAEG